MMPAAEIIERVDTMAAPLSDEAEDTAEPPEPQLRGSGFMKPLIVLALPGMYLFYKYNQYRREQRELSRRRVTERELQQLHNKIDKLLNKLDEHQPEMPSCTEDECVICVSARATMQTSPCGHRVVCRRCFVKTIQMAVSQRLLPLRCVICRAKILRLKQTLVSRDMNIHPVSSKSWILPQSASDYNMKANIPKDIAGSKGRWTSEMVPASASLYSMSSGSSSISGMSSVSSSSSSSAESYKSTNLGRSRLRYPVRSSSQKSSKGEAFKDFQNSMKGVPQGNEALQKNQKLPPIKELQRDYKDGKVSTRLRCTRKILTQLESTSSSRLSPPQESPSTSSSLGQVSLTPSRISFLQAQTSKSATTEERLSATTPKKLTVAQKVQLIKKEKEQRKEREKAEKSRLKEEKKVEKARLKEAKKLAKEEMKRAKKEAKTRKKELKLSLSTHIK